MSKLRELTIEAGPDPMDWNADDRREAVIELYQRDETAKWPTWIADAISERVACDTKERQAVIAALQLDSAAMRHAALGIIFERALLNFPLDSLQRDAEQHEGEWRAEAHACAIERDRDSAMEERLLRSGS